MTDAPKPPSDTWKPVGDVAGRVLRDVLRRLDEADATERKAPETRGRA